MLTVDIVRESNRIEGIERDPTSAEISEHDRFVNLSIITIEELERFVSVYQPDAQLRSYQGMDVRIGAYYPPRGGQHVVYMLQDILDNRLYSSWDMHIAYEKLHPFTDGNGRSGRALWWWKQRQQAPEWRTPLSFLHTFYYQTLKTAPITT